MGRLPPDAVALGIFDLLALKEQGALADLSGFINDTRDADEIAKKLKADVEAVLAGLDVPPDA